MDSRSSLPLHPRLNAVLSELRSRVRRYIGIDAGLGIVAIVLVAFWVGLAIDLLPAKLGATEMPRSARAAFLGLSLVVLAVVAYRLLFARIFRNLPDDSLALLLERHHPNLQGRLITAVQLARKREDSDSFAPLLLERVRDEAVEAMGDVDPNRVFNHRPLKRKASIVIPALLALVVLGIASPGTLRQGAARLLLLSDETWPRRADLRMVGIEVPRISAMEQSEENPVELLEFAEGVVRVAKGGVAVLRIEANSQAAEVPEVCTVYYRSDAGIRGQVNMRRVGRVRDGFQAFVLEGAPLAGIEDNLSLTIQGLDDRLDGYRIEVVESPSVVGLTVESTSPGYLREPGVEGPDLRTSYQPGLRMREGASARLIGKTSAAVAEVEAAVLRGEESSQSVSVSVSKDGREFYLDLPDVRQPTTIVLVPRDSDGISVPSPYRYFLGVVSDAEPELSMRLRGIGPAITANAKIPIEGVATDDYGLNELRLQVAPVADEVTPAYEERAVVDRDGNFTALIDFRDLVTSGKMVAPVLGQQWMVLGEGRDGYDLGPPHIARTDLIRFEIVSPEVLLATLERRELGLRMRLEQLISETSALRDALDRLRRDGWEPTTGSIDEGVAVLPIAFRQAEVKDESGDRAVQILKLRIQQSGLQASKASDELSGIAAGLEDILLEMENNRVDTPDRSRRIASGVRDPLRAVVDGSLTQLRMRIEGLDKLASDREQGPLEAGQAVQSAEKVLLELTQILEQMLDLESYNEVLDLVRDLIENQESLIEATEKQQQQSLEDLFRGLDN